MPAHVDFALEVLDPAAVGPLHVHAVLGHWLDVGAPAPGCEGVGREEVRVEHSSGRKPYALRAVRAEPYGVHVELAFLGDAAGLTLVLDEALQRHVPGSESAPHLGGQSFRAAVWQDFDSNLLVRVHQSWAAFREAPPSRHWGVKFRSPLTFRSGHVELPLPVPSLIMEGLCRSWNEWSTVPLRRVCERGGRCAHLAALRITAAEITTTKGSGAKGWTRVGCLGAVDVSIDTRDDAVFRDASALLAYANYAGIGSGTAQGFGAVDATPRTAASTARTRSRGAEHRGHGQRRRSAATG